MEFEVRIKKDGTMITTVTDRGTVECATIKQVTNALGAESSDEVIGPECDKVEEIHGGSGPTEF